MSKFIFVTGGVVSSLGKGLASASIGFLLRSRKLRISMQKLDPYINIDPGSMDPMQHGEVYVTDDGAEGDLDLGHYERFAGVTLNRRSNVTTGRIYQRVIMAERRGEYKGRTVQVVPHVTNAIKDTFKQLEKPDVDIVIVELGGTVGDIEGLPFIEAFRQFSLERDYDDVMFIHLTLVPYLKASGEIKTKPTQHSVQKLREYGIQPDIIICRSEDPISSSVKEKIAMFCNVKPKFVVDERNVDVTVYEVPVILHEQDVDGMICQRLNIEAKEADLTDWNNMLNLAANPEKTIEVALVSAHHAMADSYKSVTEALFHGGVANRTKVKIRPVDAASLDKTNVQGALGGVHGIVIPDGVPDKCNDGIITAIRFAREKGIPFLGICLGMELAVVEFAKNVARIDGAFHGGGEWSGDGFVADAAVVARLDEEKHPTAGKAAFFRKGLHAASLAKGSLIRQAYNDAELVRVRHRNACEVNPDVVDTLKEAGLFISGVNPDSQFVEAIELRDHPWFVGVIFRPEFHSRPVAPSSLFTTFVDACVKHSS